VTTKLAATKTNLLKVKKILALTREGHQLLDEKRKILMAEHSSVMQDYQSVREKCQAAFKTAYSALNRAVIAMGADGVDRTAAAIETTHEIFVMKKRVMGVVLPIFRFQMSESEPAFSPLGVDSSVDEAITRFRDAVALAVQMAEKKAALDRIMREIRKTVRKVNALEKIHLPYFEETLKYISTRLDEESREAFSTLKEIKARLGK